MEHPDAFLNVIFHAIGDAGDDMALCAGFERGQWRNDQLADHVMEWLPEFALDYSELSEISHANALRMTKKAAKIVYQTQKYGLRGEFHNWGQIPFVLPEVKKWMGDNLTHRLLRTSE